jgi:putative protease
MAAKKPTKEPDKAKETKVGTVEHYYGKVQAAAVGLSGDLKVGDTIHIKGATDDVTKKVTSMQMDHVPIQEAHKGQHVGVQIPTKVHDNSQVFKVAKTAAKPAKAAKAPAKKAAKKPKAAKRAKKARKAAKKGKRKASTRGGARKSAKKAKRSKKAGRKTRGKKSTRRGKKAK